MFYTQSPDIVKFLPEPINTHPYETNANDNDITACGAMYAGELANVYRSLDAMKIIIKPDCEVSQDIEQTFCLFIKLSQCYIFFFFFS